MGDSIEVGGIGAGGGVGVSAGKGNGTSVVDLCDEPLGQEAVRISGGGCDEIRGGCCYAWGERVRHRVSANGKKASGGQTEGSGKLYSLVPFSHNLCGRGHFVLLALAAPAAASHLGIGGRDLGL